MIEDEFWANRFHFCALAAGFIAAAEGRIEDSQYVQTLAYDLYESGAFRDRFVPPVSSSSPFMLVPPTGLSDSGS